MHAEAVAAQSRYGSGVRVMRLGEGDRVVTVSRAERAEDEDVEQPEENIVEEQGETPKAEE